jgi:hypothetical protein
MEMRARRAANLHDPLDFGTYLCSNIFNRFFHYKRGKRSKSTLERMPTVDLIEEYGTRFGSLDVDYFGSITWLFPLLRRILSTDKLIAFSDNIDKIFNIKKSAFKFTMKVTKS